MVALPRIALALAAALLLALAPAAEAKRKAPPLFMGVNWDNSIAWQAPPSVQARQFPRMAAAGVETVHVAFAWSAAQPYDRNHTDLSATDRLVGWASAHRVRVLPEIILAPRWARVSPYRQAPAQNPKDIRPYARAIVKRYGPRGSFWRDHPKLPRLPIREWQFWNEPHLPYQWTVSKGVDWRKTYTAALKAFHGAVRGVDHKAKIVLAGLTNLSWRYLAQLYRAGAGRYFEIAAINPYTRTPKGVLYIARKFRAVMKRHHQSRKPLWITEFGLPASRGRTKSRNRLQTTDKGMARYLTQAYSLLVQHRREVRVSRAYFYTWASRYGGEIFTYSGLFRYRPKHKQAAKPAYRAYVRAARRIEGCRKGRSGRCR